MTATSSIVADRAAGCIVGALIGDALGVGPHWYYDLDEQRRDYGPWIDDYTAPRPGRYHDGLRAGELSQTGRLAVLLLRSVADRGGYDEADFTRRLDEEFLPLFDGTPRRGPGGYTNQDMRDVYHHRVREGRPWNACASNTDTAEAAARLPVLAARYALDPARGADAMTAHCLLTQDDPTVAALSVAFGAVLSCLVRGEPMDADISDGLMRLVESGALPFGGGKRFPTPDALLLPGSCAEAASDPGVRIEPAWKVCGVYGLPCAIYGPLPAAYYLAARFAGQFEAPVLHALNGGGQNLNRATLTGALAGAQVGLSGIPKRFVAGLADGAEIVELARQVGGGG